MSDTIDVLREVAAERIRQDTKWGEQNHPNGTGSAEWILQAAAAKNETDRQAKAGSITYLHILSEEVAEAFAENNPERLRAELVQVAAVSVAWIECIDRRAMTTEASDEAQGGST